MKFYISGGEAKQNIDASRIETRTGNEGTATSEQWIVPAGATFPEAGTTTPVDGVESDDSFNPVPCCSRSLVISRSIELIQFFNRSVRSHQTAVPAHLPSAAFFFKLLSIMS